METQQQTATTESTINVASLKPPVPAQSALDQSPELELPVETENLPAVLPAAEVVELTTTTMTKQPKGFPGSLLEEERIFLGQDGKAYSIRTDAANPYAVPVNSKQFANVIRERALEQGINLRKNDISDIVAMLQAYADKSKVCHEVWYRIAPIQSGVVIDLGDGDHTQVRITAGNVEIGVSDSNVFFFRSAVTKDMPLPAETGDLRKLNKYLNVSPVASVLMVGWITYILAHPKVSTSKYPILVLNGGQGSGKSSLCNNILSKLIDPSRIGLQILPSNSKDLAIAAQNAHVLFYDNVRGFSQNMADILCVASTGGVISSRQLYTDADMATQSLHVALVLNGIHSFINQPDLAQRCLPIQLRTIPEDKRKSDTVLVQEFNADLPYILRGLFDLIADIFTHLGKVPITNPERMIDFVQWLAAMEAAHGAPTGVYQQEYSEALRHGQLDSLQENELAAAVLDFVEELQGITWQGTPEELLSELNSRASKGTLRSKEWPLNPIALSKRLAVLEAGLLSQGITITSSRGKRRTIRIASSAVGREV